MKILPIINNKNNLTNLARGVFFTTALALPISVNGLERTAKSDNFFKIENVENIKETAQYSSKAIQKNNEKIILTTFLRDMEICPFSFVREDYVNEDEDDDNEDSAIANEFADIFLSFDLVNLPIPLDGSLKKVINHNGPMRMNSEKHFKYDNNGRVLQIKHDKSVMKWDTNKKFSYNPKGLIDVIYHEKGPMKWATSRIHKYDENGSIIHIKHENSPMKWDTSRDFIYDDRGRLVKIHSNKGLGKWDREVKITYGSNGKIAQAEHCHPIEFNTKTKFEYDSKNRLIKMTYITGPMESNRTKIFTYNQQGQLIKIVTQLPMASDPVTEFKYDNKGRLMLIKHNATFSRSERVTEFVWE